MSRLAVPRGNGYDPPPHAHPIDSSSPRWPQLTPDEQSAAVGDLARRPVMHAVMAAHTLRECLGDARRAPTGEEWLERRDRVRRVKAVLFGAMFGGEDGPAVRERWQLRLRSRLLLLHVERADAEAAAAQAVAHLFRWKESGESPPPRYGTLMPNWPAGRRFRSFGDDDVRARSQSHWQQDHELLREGADLLISRYLDDELRAFRDDPLPDEFLIARGPVIPRAGPPVVTAEKLTTLEAASDHVLLAAHLASCFVANVARCVGGRESLSYDEQGERAAASLKHLMREWVGKAIEPGLLAELTECRDAPFEFPPVVGTSVHEVAIELVRQVVVAFRSRVGLDEPASFEVLVNGSWEGCEVGRAILPFWSDFAELRDAFNAINSQRLAAELRLEALRAVRRRDTENRSGVVEASPPEPEDAAEPERPQRGRPQKYDPAVDKNIYEVVEAGFSKEGIAKEKGMTIKEVDKAIKRHKWREGRG